MGCTAIRIRGDGLSLLGDVFLCILRFIHGLLPQLLSYKGVKTASAKRIVTFQVEKGMGNMGPRCLSRKNTAFLEASHILDTLFP